MRSQMFHYLQLRLPSLLITPSSASCYSRAYPDNYRAGGGGVSRLFSGILLLVGTAIILARNVLRFGYDGRAGFAGGQFGEDLLGDNVAGFRGLRPAPP